MDEQSDVDVIRPQLVFDLCSAHELDRHRCVVGVQYGEFLLCAGRGGVVVYILLANGSQKAHSSCDLMSTHKRPACSFPVHMRVEWENNRN